MGVTKQRLNDSRLYKNKISYEEQKKCKKLSEFKECEINEEVKENGRTGE
jgi:hypothetical protein